MLWQYLVVVLASVVQSLGLTLQRASHVDSGAIALPSIVCFADAETETSRVRRAWLWRLGIFLFIFANVFGSSVQLAVLPLALVCTLQASGLVANALFAVLILREPFTKLTMFGTLLVIVGAVMVAGLGKIQEDPSLPLSKLLTLFWKPKFLTWIGITMSLGAVCWILARRLELKQQSYRHRLLSTRTRIGALYGVLGGLASAHSLLMAKLAIGLLVRDYRDVLTDLLDPHFYFIVLLFLVCALSQMGFVSRGLEHVSTSAMYPLVFCVYNVCTIVNSAVFYGDKRHGDGPQLTYIVLGTIVLIIGVLLLSARLEDHTQELLPTSTTATGTTTYIKNTSTENPFSDYTEEPPSTPPANPRPINTSPNETTSANRFKFYTDDAPPAHTMAPVSLSVPPGGDLPVISSVDEGEFVYTSFDTLSPNITTPHHSRNKFSRKQLSKEQTAIMRELCM